MDQRISLIPQAHEVPLQELEPGTRFCMHVPPAYGLPETRVYGQLLYKTAGRTRVLLAASRHNVAGEENWPLTITVEPIDYREPRLSPKPQAVELERSSETPMATQQEKDSKVIQATGLQARYDFQAKQLSKALDAGKVDQADVIQGKIDRLLEEAKAKGISLHVVEQPAEEPEPEPVPVAKPKPAAKPQQQVKAAAQTPEAKLALAALDKAADRKAGMTVEKRAKTTRSSHNCLCGCNTETLSLFAPGHDARIKGMLLKVERGELDRSVIPETVAPFVKFKGKWGTDSFEMTACPVKIPGRPDVKHTGLEALEAMDV